MAAVVLGLGHDIFEEILEDEKARLGRALDTDVTAEEWRGVVARYKEMMDEELGESFPEIRWRSSGAQSARSFRAG